jgi:HTH-type transcriptional regulator, glycine betaine synthesis regulator
VSFLRQSSQSGQVPTSHIALRGAKSDGLLGRAVRKAARRRLSATQRDIVLVCEAAVQQFGFSRSVGQIFGVVYCSPEPLAFADVVESLELSNGSVSQGLRFLREFGAIKLVSVPGDRRELFAAETELRRLLVSALQTRLRVPLESGSERLKALKKRLRTSSEPDREFLSQRLDSLQTWHRKALLILPLVQRFLGSDRG